MSTSWWLERPSGHDALRRYAGDIATGSPLSFRAVVEFAEERGLDPLDHLAGILPADDARDVLLEDIAHIELGHLVDHEPSLVPPGGSPARFSARCSDVDVDVDVDVIVDVDGDGGRGQRQSFVVIATILAKRSVASA